MYKIPPEFEDYEAGRVIKLETNPAAKPSLGELYAARDEERPTLEQGPKARRDLQLGQFLVYKGEVKKRCRLGCITEIFEAEKKLAVHYYAAQCDHRLRICWKPTSKGPEGIRLGPGEPVYVCYLYSRVEPGSACA